MTIARIPAVLVAALALFACSKAPEPASSATAARTGAATTSPVVVPAPSAHAEQAIAWETGDVDAAFAKAKAEEKPLFLYWGAAWCPPCNEVKATIFTRQDFIERARQFVPVYIDGDAKGAQKLGTRFKVSGYPTMVLFTPDGREITRLPGEVEADRYMQVLALGMGGARPVRETLTAALGKDASARSGPRTGECSRGTRGSPTRSSCWTRTSGRPRSRASRRRARPISRRSRRASRCRRRPRRRR